MTTDEIALLQAYATIFFGLATIVTYFIITKMANKNNKFLTELNNSNNRLAKINHDLDRVVDVTIQYPYFEDVDYIANHYKKDLTSDNVEVKNKALRYEMFAIMNFNLIEDAYKHFKGNEKDMADLFNFEEMILSHSEYWNHKIVDNGESGYSAIADMVNRIIEADKKS